MSETSFTAEVVPIDPALMDFPDGMRYLGNVSEVTLRRICNRGEIETCYVGRRRMLVVASLRSYVARRTASTMGE